MRIWEEQEKPSNIDCIKIRQNKLAVVLDVDRAVSHRWFHEQIDSNPETVADIVKALNLKSIDVAAEELITVCVADLMQDDDPLAI